jgi:hypothetical protein
MFAPRREFYRRPLVALLAILASLHVGSGQTGTGSPSALIRSLSKERPKGRPIIAIFRCGLIDGTLWERRTAGDLVQLGRTALPALERALDSVEKKGWQSDLYENAHWLFFAYARVLGPAAAPRLLRMRKNPKLAEMRRSIDDALALSFRLTSYVSGAGGPSPSLGCRGEQPRDALDQLVESLERGDLTGLQKVLGPEARAALGHDLVSRSWETLRRKSWHLQPGVDYALGYRFEIEGRWSEPEETLEQPREEYRGPLVAADRFSLETQFTNSAGKGCGRHEVDFLTTKTPPSLIQEIYRINNTDIEDLLRSIAACASE